MLHFREACRALLGDLAVVWTSEWTSVDICATLLSHSGSWDDSDKWSMVAKMSGGLPSRAVSALKNVHVIPRA